MVSYCIPVGGEQKSKHGQKHILKNITLERPKASWEEPSAVFREVLNDSDTGEESNSLLKKDQLKSSKGTKPCSLINITLACAKQGSELLC